MAIFSSKHTSEFAQRTEESNVYNFGIATRLIYDMDTDVVILMQDQIPYI